MATGGDGSGSLNQGAHLRGGVRSTSSRLREDLQAVVRSSLTPLMEPVQPPSSLASHLSALLPPSASGASTQSQQQSSWPPQPTSSMANSNPGTLQPGSSWQENITVTIQQQPHSFSNQHQPQHHVLDMDAEQGGGAGAAGGGGGGGSGDGDQEQETGWSAILSTNPELRAVVSACEKYIPFLLIILVKSVFEHGKGIIVCVGLVLTFLHANSVLRQQVARQARRNLGALLAISVNMVACCAFIYYVFLDDQLVLSAFFIPPSSVTTFYDLVWIVGVNDFVLKFLAVLAKVAITLLPASILPYQKRGKHYLFLEVTSQLHRQLVPLQPWLMYLLAASDEQGPASIPNKVLGVFLTAAYMVVKGRIFMRALKLWRAAFYKLLQSTRYGKTPSADQMKASGGFCPICQDAYQEPTMLHCQHIFCEECVATWFDRDTTCPMCRAKVSEDPSWRDGATSQFIQLF